MRQVGEVTAVTGSKAEILVKQRSACANCRQKCLMAHETKEIRVEVTNSTGAEVGDFVILDLGDNQVLSAALLIYIVPVVFLFGGVLGSLGLGLSETWAMLAGVGGLIVSFLIIKFAVDPYLRQHGALRPQIIGRADGICHEKR